MAKVEVVFGSPEAPAVPAGKWARKRLAASPIQVTGTWAGVRKWKDGADRAGKLLVYCQVMAGFELLALREAHPETRGGDQRKQKAGDMPFARPEPFYEMVQREVGISRVTTQNWMRMAEAAIPKLKKLAHLKDWDPTTVALGALPEPQLKALGEAVHKLTDGLTQTEFLEQLGLAKVPQGSGATGGYRPRQGPPPTIEEQAAEAAQECRLAFQDVASLLERERGSWMLLHDDEIRAQIQILERHLALRKEWVRRPAAARDPLEFERMIKGR